MLGLGSFSPVESLRGAAERASVRRAVLMPSCPECGCPACLCCESDEEYVSKQKANAAAIAAAKVSRKRQRTVAKAAVEAPPQPPPPPPTPPPPPEDLSSMSVGELKQRLGALGISLDGMLEKSDLVTRLMAGLMAAQINATLPPPAEAASRSEHFLLADPPLPPEQLTLAKQAANSRSKPAAKQRSSRMAGWGGRRERNALVHQVALAEKYTPEVDDARLVREEWVATEKFDGIRAVWVPG